MDVPEPARHPPDHKTRGLTISEHGRELYLKLKGHEITESDYCSSIFDLVLKPLTSYVNHRCGSWRRFQDIEDIVQEVLRRFFRFKLELDQKPLMPWLVMVAKNICIDEGRKYMLREHTCFDEQSPLHGSSSHPAHSDNWLRQLVLREACKALPWEEFFAIDMCYFQGESQSDVAEMLAVPRSTVEHYLLSAKRRLKKMTPVRELAVAGRPRTEVTHV